MASLLDGAHVAGVCDGGLTANTWYPPSRSDPWHAVRLGTEGLETSFGMNVLRELVRLGNKRFDVTLKIKLAALCGRSVPGAKASCAGTAELYLSIPGSPLRQQTGNPSLHLSILGGFANCGCGGPPLTLALAEPRPMRLEHCAVRHRSS